MPYRKIFAQNLIEFRKKEHISQTEMAYRTEVSRETISLIERESTNISLDVMEKLISYTGYTAGEMLTENFVKDSLKNDDK